MTLPDVRRLLQVIFAPEPPRQRERQAIRLSEWRQRRNLYRESLPRRDQKTNAA